MKDDIRPMRNLVLIRRRAAEEVSKGGIIIPDVAKERPLEGEVIAVGPGIRRKDGSLRPVCVEVGQRVLFGKYSGHDNIPGVGDMIMVPDDDIRGVIEEG